MKNVLKDSKLFVQVGGVVLDATLYTSSEVISYYPCYDAYLTATDALKQSLLTIYIETNHGDLPGTTVKDSWLRVSLMAAIDRTLRNDCEGTPTVRDSSASSSQTTAGHTIVSFLKNLSRTSRLWRWLRGWQPEREFLRLRSFQQLKVGA